MKLRHKDLLGLAHLTAEEIELILNAAVPFKRLFTRSIKKVPTLRGKTVALLFYEPSTRTRTSFELAATRLSADVLSLSVSSSSVQKGETLTDTALNLEAMKVDYIVLRHSVSGAPELLARAGRPDVLVVDPPRAGLSKKVVHRIIETSPKRIVYVSCNPTTLAPNAAELVEAGWALRSVRPVDMFPQTHHIETVSLLERK